MSKLFETLEKIQEHEEGTPQVDQPVAPRPARKTGRYVPFLAGLTIIGAIIYGGQYFPELQKQFFRDSQPVIEKTPPPASTAKTQHPAHQVSAPENMTDLARVEYLNNQAVALSTKGDNWSALYYFDQASKLAPSQPEPLINMAILLSEMGLIFPADRVFREAYQVDPEHTHLLQAIELAISEQVLAPDFYETIPSPVMGEN